MSTLSRIGDLFGMGEPIFLDCGWSQRHEVRRLLESHGVHINAINRHSGYLPVVWPGKVIVTVKRYHGATARAVLAAAGYREV